VSTQRAPRAARRGRRRIHGHAAAFVQFAPALLVDIETLHLEAALQQMVRECLPHQSHAHYAYAIAHPGSPLRISLISNTMPP
jgi:hypothetical protein